VVVERGTMRIGVKPGQIGLSVAELQLLWREAEDAGFESIWTFDHLTGPLCYEAVTLLAAMAVVTERARIGCLVLANGTRQVESLAAQLATIDALSGGRLEVGLGTASSFAKQDFVALGLRYASWEERVRSYQDAIDRLIELTLPSSPLSARPIQMPLPLILGGGSAAARKLAIDKQLSWNLSTDSVEEFARLKAGQHDPQVQVPLSRIQSVPETVARFREVGATRLVFVLMPPIKPRMLHALARDSGL
jgi:alkanesulfonate monooxygenase SsuD/methylene tetrahydromethanopterin reductase-like flavin-dependent oxidoreductase (luciferase family)